METSSTHYCTKFTGMHSYCFSSVCWTLRVCNKSSCLSGKNERKKSGLRYCSCECFPPPPSRDCEVFLQVCCYQANGPGSPLRLGSKTGRTTSITRRLLSLCYPEQVVAIRYGIHACLGNATVYSISSPGGAGTRHSSEPVELFWQGCLRTLALD